MDEKKLKVHTDDTLVRVLEPGRGKTRTGRLWVYVRDDRNTGATEPPARYGSHTLLTGKGNTRSSISAGTTVCFRPMHTVDTTRWMSPDASEAMSECD